MPQSEDLNLFLNDFGVSCTAGAVSALGILDMPGQVIAGGMVITTEYTLTAKASDLGWLLYGDMITVENDTYEVRDLRLIDDGRFCEIAMSKVVDTSRVFAPTVYIPGVFQ